MALPSPQDTLARRLAFMRQVLLFAGLGREELSVLVDDLRLCQYEDGEIVFHQGDPGYELYIVMQGKVRVYRTSPSGEETTITICPPGDVFGEFAVLDDLPRSATVQALGRCSLLAMARDRLTRRMHEFPDLAIAMARLLAEKARWTAAFAEAIAQFDAAGRLLHILLLYNEQFGQEIEAGKRYVIDLALSQSGLASLVGARREWVNRLLQDWRRRGLLEHRDGKVYILDLEAVRRERDSRTQALDGEAVW